MQSEVAEKPLVKIKRDPGCLGTLHTGSIACPLALASLFSAHVLQSLHVFALGLSPQVAEGIGGRLSLLSVCPSLRG